MPKIVDHAARRAEIAQVACSVVALHGFDQATTVRIAEAAGYTTGMIAHYFDSKQEIIKAALQLTLHRVEERLKAPHETLFDVLSQMLPLDEPRAMEASFWTAFWGQVPTDPYFKRLNAWVHREYGRLYRRCFEQHWREWSTWPESVRRVVQGAIVTCVDGLTLNSALFPKEYPRARLLRELRLHVDLWHTYGVSAAGSGAGAAPVRRRRSAN
jgi:AcrR family transcriptional regulator